MTDGCTFHFMSINSHMAEFILERKVLKTRCSEKRGGRTFPKLHGRGGPHLSRLLQNRRLWKLAALLPPARPMQRSWLTWAILCQHLLTWTQSTGQRTSPPLL